MGPEWGQGVQEARIMGGGRGGDAEVRVGVGACGSRVGG